MMEVTEEEIVVNALAPMSNAPQWDRYNGNVDTVLALVKRDIDSDETNCYWCEVYFNRDEMAFSSIENDTTYEDWQLVGWIPAPSFDLSLIENKETNAA